jgi:predicted dehydrogenase
MKREISRRKFLQSTAAVAGGIATIGPAMSRAANAANNKVTFGVIGCNGRGMDHIAGLLAVPEVEIAYVCDVDSRARERGVEAVARKQGTKPKGEKDLRRMLEDPRLDAVSIAAPDHWHTPAGVMACKAGKHVYVEKPGSHNFHESELIVAAARKHKRLVQMGNQRRSWPWVVETLESLRAGEIGKLFFARCWYTNHRPTIGRGKPAPVPEWLDYSLWQGPAPEKPFHDNILHYNWHWFWNWGTGELGNNGVHSLDLARWGLGVDLPRRVTCSGGRYHFKDDWETPDTAVATFDFGEQYIVWEGQSCDPRGFEGAGFGVNFYGENGTLAIAGNNSTFYDLNNKVLKEIKSTHGGPFNSDAIHFANLVEAIRGVGKPLRAEIEEGQKSTKLCHLGNIAFRTDGALQFNPQTRKILGEKTAANLMKREYRHGWEPTV